MVCHCREGSPEGDRSGSDRTDIVGKPYRPEQHIDVWFNET